MHGFTEALFQAIRPPAGLNRSLTFSPPPFTALFTHACDNEGGTGRHWLPDPPPAQDAS